jgi:hypothetical protein
VALQAFGYDILYTTQALMMQDVLSSNDFYPIFIVGPPRCGTTMLAVLLDRHSRISVPPETQFFCGFIPEVWGNKQPENREKIVESALNYSRIADLGLKSDEVLLRFEHYTQTFPNLLRAILESYCINKNKSRPAEKTPRHLYHVPAILNAYPKAKIICIIRDGRDMVLSKLKAHWARAKNPRRFGLFCNEWMDYVQAALKFAKYYSPDRFLIIKYEQILLEPERRLSEICKFIGEKFEPGQLDPKISSHVVPDWEMNWKAKANSILDPTRIEAWRREADHLEIWAMNNMMGPLLKKTGYPDTGMTGCPWPHRIYLSLRRVPYSRPIRPISLFGLKVLRQIKACYS